MKVFAKNTKAKKVMMSLNQSSLIITVTKSMMVLFVSGQWEQMFPKLLTGAGIPSSGGKKKQTMGGAIFTLM